MYVSAYVLHCIVYCTGCTMRDENSAAKLIEHKFYRFADSTIVRLSIKHLARNVLSKGGPENPLIYPIGSAVSGVDG